MRRLPTRLEGLVRLQPAVHGDERGFFSETWREDAWSEHGVPSAFVQDNHSRSRRGTVGIGWPAGVELLFSQRDRYAPRLAEVADSLPFTV